MLNKRLKAVILLAGVLTTTTLVKTGNVHAKEVSTASKENIQSSKNNEDNGIVADALINMQDETAERDLNGNKEKTNVLVENNTLLKELDSIKGYISSTKNVRNTIINDLGFSENSIYVNKINKVIDKLHLSTTILVENALNIIKENNDAKNVDVAIKLANDAKSYLTNNEKLSSSSSYIQRIETALNNFQNSKFSIYEKNIENKINTAIEQKSPDKLLDAINFAKTSKNELITKYNFKVESELITNINTLIEDANRLLPEIKASYGIDVINKAIPTKNLDTLENAKKVAVKIRSELIENFYIMPKERDVVRIDSAIKRLDSAIEEARKNAPVDAALKSIDDVIAKGEYTYASKDEATRAYNELMDSVKFALSLKEKTSDTTLKENIDKGIDKAIFPLINASINAIRGMNGSNCENYFKDLYEASQRLYSLKDFFKNTLKISDSSPYMNNVNHAIDEMKQKSNLDTSLRTLNLKLDSLKGMKDYEEKIKVINYCEYIRVHLLDDLKLSPENSKVQEMTDKIVKAKQNILSEKYYKSPEIQIVQNPNWFYTGLPDKIQVREKEAQVNNIVIDIICNGRTQIRDNEVVFLDKTEENNYVFVKEIIEHIWKPSFGRSVKFATNDGTIVDDFSKVPDTGELAAGSKLFSIVISTRATIVNRTYWERLESSKDNGTDDNVTVSASISTGKEESVTRSLSKMLGNESSISSEFGMSAGVENVGSVSGTFSQSDSVSRSFESTFERSFSVSEEIQKGIEHDFGSIDKNSAVGLYQLVEEFEILNADGLVNQEREFLSGLDLTLKFNKNLKVKTSRYAPIAIEENQKFITPSNVKNASN
ncbi:hypothetical protein [Clostridium oceanicum]|uniref:Uncharacterized protein n=1 Tax=Clostridium oceanicum TaxID=1543 RepID=A0ABN1JL85_9CLOT